MRPRYCHMHIFIILSAISVACSDSFFSKENNAEQDRMALMALRDEFISSDSAPDVSTVLNSWNSSHHFCEWQGIACGARHKRVVAINLPKQKLDGVVSPSIGNLTFLRLLRLTNNSLHGDIPKEIGRLWRLRYIYLGGNFFDGRIPIELSNCSNLLTLNLYDNKLTGQIPFHFGSFLKLKGLYAHRNNLVGEMPTFLMNISSLTDLFLGSNHFHGEIKDSLVGFSKLVILSLSSNGFSGTISPLYNISSLQTLDTSNNNFTGALAQDIDVAFPKATFLGFAQNSFTGQIPSSLSNISGLTVFQINKNNLMGRVPDNLGKLKNLHFLQLTSNHLGSDQSDDLSFIDSLTNCTKLKKLFIGDNRFGGSLADSIANFTSHLQYLSVAKNYITGRIPEGIVELSGLSVVEFSCNFLTGTIPSSIGKLTNMSRLRLRGNILHGGIPYSVGNFTKLFELLLYGNSLDGEIPTTLGDCNGMEVIDISSNHLSGNLPDGVFTQFQDLRICNISDNSFGGPFPLVFGKLRALNTLDASSNNFSGEIPSALGESVQLAYLNMAGNFFQGSIPASFGRLRNLADLDLSNNNLSGGIPIELASIPGLKNLNLSFNKLEGEVPFFKNVSATSIVGNPGLCGGNLELHLQPCRHLRKEEIFSRKVVIAISVSVITSFSLFAVVFIFCRGYRIRKKDDADSLDEKYKRVTYKELFKATEGFAESHLIGTGSFGDVYKAILDQDKRKPVAVKVLNLSKHGAAKSFAAECKVLRRIRHRNLLRIITSCSSLDYKGNDFKALVFDFMSNGSLDNWLHSIDSHQETRVLTLAKRLEVSIDVGCALDYLHNGCETPVVHCDLKPSNILLDDDMVAHVGDFGLAKLYLGLTGSPSGDESLSTAFKGTIGYVAPEYGMGSAISPQGDVYSYGILLLELITSRRPTDDIFNEEMSLLSFCERAIPDHVEDIVDRHLMNELHETIPTQRNPEQIKLQCHSFLVSLVEVGISCAALSPRDRMDIQSAIGCLKRIKEKFDSTFTE